MQRDFALFAVCLVIFLGFAADIHQRHTPYNQMLEALSLEPGTETQPVTLWGEKP
jgi:hypothetical protein